MDRVEHDELRRFSVVFCNDVEAAIAERRDRSNKRSVCCDCAAPVVEVGAFVELSSGLDRSGGSQSKVLGPGEEISRDEERIDSYSNSLDNRLH